MPGIHIGTSGWNYRHWANGRFYPQGLKPGDWLRFLAGHFDTVEVNYSFYRIPTRESVAKWQAATPPGFLFAMKLWRGITQFRKLSDPAGFLAQFLSSANIMPPSRRGPLLVQLPPSMGLHLQRLDAFLIELERQTNASPWRVAVEFRHPSWLVERVYRLLNEHRAAVVLADLGRCPITEPNDVDFVYVRRHGGWHHPEGRYLPEQIAADAERIKGWRTTGKTVYVYYNNDLNGHAVDNARELAGLVGLRE
ncbi:MAG TPA: DUF72 domain-containing protein [Phycisphaerae bacterium]|nr:DUF72 domain-containing protein [Phycisphaerae bacterium]HOJ55148.1 DUF72 domain-containing protein [Phycisphaerae bacterium]HOL27350.1 DUF72 domain-containing protein [Phycisphaerae bacterium]HPP20710.1 DUF72 domain-containing protein [Phycisphaerae bacterium]HPU34125.1 DUF72 domain-containing protein [Phycisphaerae bacterium]